MSYRCGYEWRLAWLSVIPTRLLGRLIIRYAPRVNLVITEAVQKIIKIFGQLLIVIPTRWCGQIVHLKIQVDSSVTAHCALSLEAAKVTGWIPEERGLFAKYSDLQNSI